MSPEQVMREGVEIARRQGVAVYGGYVDNAVTQDAAGKWVDAPDQDGIGEEPGEAQVFVVDGRVRPVAIRRWTLTELDADGRTPEQFAALIVALHNLLPNISAS